MVLATVGNVVIKRCLFPPRRLVWKKRQTEMWDVSEFMRRVGSKRTIQG